MTEYTRPVAIKDVKRVIQSLNDNHGETFERLRSFAETIELDGVSIRTINLEGLMRTKRTARDKDAIPRDPRC